MVFALREDNIIQSEPEDQGKNPILEKKPKNLSDFEIKVSNASGFELNFLQRVRFKMNFF